MSGKHIALLRGINVGGRKLVDMSGLRGLLEDLGYADVRTLLNSGNAVFTSDRAPSRTVIEKAIAAKYGFDVAVLLRSASALAKVVSANPFDMAAADGSRVFVGFLDRALPPAALKPLELAQYAPEALHSRGQELYYSLPHGLADSKLMKDVTEKKLGVTATLRNWNTVLKINALVDDD